METINISRTNKKGTVELGEILDEWIRSNLRGEIRDPALYRDQDLNMIRNGYLEYRRDIEQLNLSVKKTKQRATRKS